jgi:YbgC/YbaW family acyl-CoA thioester hydrolase
VRWAEVDMQAIVFNAHYLMYLDIAITEYWRASAMPYTESFRALGGDIVVRKATVDFIDSARMDDVLDVGMRFVEAGRSSMRFQGAVFRGDELLATGELAYVYIDPHATKGTKPSREVPQALRDALAAFERGDAMTHLHLGDWASVQARAMPLRHTVFAVEKGIPPELMSDAADAIPRTMPSSPTGWACPWPPGGWCRWQKTASAGKLAAWPWWPHSAARTWAGSC